jgi:O-antigen ligase
MLSRLAVTFLRWASTALLLVVLIFSDQVVRLPTGFVGSGIREIAAILHDPETKCILLMCLAMYFAVFLLLRSRKGAGFWRQGNPDLSLICVLAVSAVVYALDYSPSGQALTLIAGTTLGCGIAAWAGCETKEETSESRNTAGAIVFVLVLILLSAALWQVESAHMFFYRDSGRWTGPWDNPNIFGVLMGAGLVLAGTLVQGPKSKARSPSSVRGPQSMAKCSAATIWKWTRLVTCVASAGLTGLGLMKSYSRGAWMGTLIGMAYLFWIKVRSPRSDVQGCRFACFGRSSVWLSIIFASTSLLCFWGFRQTNWHPAQRVVSIANANDFSWRNRVSAWEGTLQMMAERPWFGFGWEKSDQVYDKLHRSSKVVESGAIILNDYCTLGTTLGIPALACFVAYVGLCLRTPSSNVQGPKSGIGSQHFTVNHPPLEARIQSHVPIPESEIQSPTSQSSLQPGCQESTAGQKASERGQAQEASSYPTLEFGLWTSDLPRVCRAAAIVLLVGFWFDGGLFKLPTATVFWILIELGREDVTPDDVNEQAGLNREEAEKTQQEAELLKCETEGRK